MEDANSCSRSPVYAKVQDENVKVRRRGAKLPQALPLQKVSKRKASHIDPTEWDLDENDEEVLNLMDGVLTKVGKPSGPTSSGKILSTVQNCPITVKWLLENFESMVGKSLPRLNKIDSVNAASFGKLIRSVFLGLWTVRTRRLGRRGNSKYHYYGIKIKEKSHLWPILNNNRVEQDLLIDTVNGRIRKRVRRTQSVYTGKHVKGLVIDKKVEIQAIDNMIQDILGILAIAMSGFPKHLLHGKQRALTAFMRLWKQYSKMRQLSEFVELTLENETSILAMRQHIISNMLEHICDRTTVVLESKTMSSEMILRMMTYFAQALKKEQSLDLWCDWASSGKLFPTVPLKL
ncbi:unnamed protein product [Orchesella dallaii]|uniref:RFX-type winged-helix domain-containing protein n=1 Tax=Orchesella dallaii TaxID=48710 RepID=A0ABP1Q9U9_9HEXA